MSDNKTQKNGNLVPAKKSELIKYSHALVSRGVDLAKKITLESINNAAEQGDAGVQFNLGEMYRSGKGVQQQDDVEALKWCRNAAEQGHADAQNNLGVMYNRGKGVQQDYAEVVKWYQKAAEQGFVKAQFNLGGMYCSGKGVMQSGEAAADWYYKAGLSYLKEDKKDAALNCVESIKGLNVPNAFLADKLLTAIYGGKESQK